MAKENANEVGQTKKFTYDELKNMASELYTQNQKLSQQCQRMQQALESQEFNYMSFFLSMLFKVLEHAEYYTDDFTKWCIDNIQSALTAFANSMHPNKPEQPAESTEEEKKDADE